MIGSSTDLPAGQGSGHPHPYQLGPWPRSLRCQARLWWAASSRCGSRVPSMSGMARRIRRTPRSGLRCPIASARDTSDRAARWCSPTRLGARDLSRRQRPELSNLALCLMRLGRSRDRPGPLPRGGGRRGLREAHVTVQKDVKARSPLPRRPPVVAPYTTRPPPLVVPDTSCSESELVPGGLRTRGASRSPAARPSTGRKGGELRAAHPLHQVTGNIRFLLQNLTEKKSGSFWKLRQAQTGEGPASPGRRHGDRVSAAAVRPLREHECRECPPRCSHRQHSFATPRGSRFRRVRRLAVHDSLASMDSTRTANRSASLAANRASATSDLSKEHSSAERPTKAQ
jgi:hypothetical protein